MTEVKTGCQDYQAGESAIKCLSQGPNRLMQVGFKLTPC